MKYRNKLDFGLNVTRQEHDTNTQPTVSWLIRAFDLSDDERNATASAAAVTVAVSSGSSIGCFSGAFSRFPLHLLRQSPHSFFLLFRSSFWIFLLACIFAYAFLFDLHERNEITNTSKGKRLEVSSDLNKIRNIRIAHCSPVKWDKNQCWIKK